jgi:hypothetical protein
MEAERRSSALLADKRGLPLEDLAARVIAAALGAAIITAIDAWHSDNGNGDLVELVDRAIDALARGMQELKA